MKKSWCFSILFTALIVLLLASSSAFALDMEYRVYGGYDPVVLSLKRVALIFSDSTYSSLLFVFATMGLFFGGASVYLRIFMGAKAGVLSWAWPVGIGLVLYLATIVPKGNLIITDPVLNKFEVVGGMPDGIVAVAGILSSFEEIFVRVIETSGNIERNNDMGFSLINSATKLPHSLADSYMQSNLIQYATDCVSFEIQRPGSDLDLDKLLKTSANIKDELAKAANPAISTTLFSKLHPEGMIMTCNALWTAINAYVSQPTSTIAAQKAVCSKNGYQDTAMDMGACNERFKKSLTAAAGLDLGIGEFDLQYAMAEATSQVLGSGDDLATASFMASKSMIPNMMGMGIVVNEWLPIMRGIITAIAFALIPFLVLFIPTPMFGKALGTIIGLFLWLTCWKITDVIVTGLASDFAVSQFAPQIDLFRGTTAWGGASAGQPTPGTAGLGIMGMAMMQTSSDKALAMFGYMRTVSIMLATVLSSMLVKFGGHAMGMMAGNMQGVMQGSGGQAGQVVGSPEGRTQAQSQVRNAMGNAMKFSQVSMMDEANAHSAEGVSQIRGISTAMGAAGGYRGYVDGQSNATTKQKMEALGSGAAAAAEGWGNVRDKANFQTTFGYKNTDQLKEIAATAGGIDKLAEQMNAPQSVTASVIKDHFGGDIGRFKNEFLKPNMNESIGNTEGKLNAFAEAKRNGFKGDYPAFHELQSRVNSSKGFSGANVSQELANKYYGGKLQDMHSDLAMVQQGAQVAKTKKLTDGYQDRGGVEQLASDLGTTSGASELGKLKQEVAIGGEKLESMAGADVAQKEAGYDANRVLTQQLMNGGKEFKNDEEYFKALKDFTTSTKTAGKNVSLDATMAKAMNDQLKAKGIAGPPGGFKAGDSATFSYDRKSGTWTVNASRGAGASEKHLFSYQAGKDIQVLDNKVYKSHKGKVVRHGNDEHYGNKLRRGGDTHIGDVDRRGNDEDYGDKLRKGQVTEIGDRHKDFSEKHMVIKDKQTLDWVNKMAKVAGSKGDMYSMGDKVDVYYAKGEGVTMLKNGSLACHGDAKTFASLVSGSQGANRDEYKNYVGVKSGVHYPNGVTAGAVTDAAPSTNSARVAVGIGKAVGEVVGVFSKAVGFFKNLKGAPAGGKPGVPDPHTPQYHTPGRYAPHTAKDEYDMVQRLFGMGH